MGKVVRGSLASLFIVAGGIAGEVGQAQSAEQGKQIFTEKAEPPCALCHTLKAAGSTGEVGPNLDDMKPDLEKTLKAVRNGVGAMPPYGETLSEAEIKAVAAFVANAVGAK